MQFMSIPAERLPRTVIAAAGLVIGGLAASQPAVAAASDCTAIEADAQRLACYDKEFPRQPARASTSGGWRIHAPGSSGASRNDASAWRASDSNIQCRWVAPHPARLTIQCKDNVTSVSFETGCYMTSSQYRDYGYVTYRLDESDARVAHMIAGPESHSLGFWSGDAAIPFIREMLGKRRISVKMTPYSEDAVSTSFDLRGLEEALQPVRKQCGW